MSATPKQSTNTVVWFEIPAADFDRAVRFYERIFDTVLRKDQFGAATIGVFPYEGSGVSGCITLGDGYKPASTGTVVYLNCDGRLDAVLDRVEAAGGRIALPKFELPRGIGFSAQIIDTEGNRIGLHASKD